ncbi:MAG: hypothetical protein LBK82_08265, partial [Planctomycetaceae bacterium]|nr:hypothetical protein [Planctomycetaceae bacterium]
MNDYYNEYNNYWKYVDDVYVGVSRIKSAENAKTYLPLHPSEMEDESLYRMRLMLTHFDNAFRPTIDAIVGIMQKNPAKVRFGVSDNNESPKEVQELNIYGNAYKDGLTGLKSRLNHAQVLYGRAGLLLDIDDWTEGNRKPHFIIYEYPATQILDGEPDQWVLLDESTTKFDSKN